MTGRRRARGIFVSIVVVFGALLISLGVERTAAASKVHRYAGQSSTTTFYGIDGYIRVSGTVMVDPYNNFHASFVNLCPWTDCRQWVQVGQFQGTGGVPPCPGPTCIRSTTYVHGYWENYLSCGLYAIEDTGDVHLDPNVAYYVSNIGTGFSPCERQEPRFAFRHGSITNPPDGYGYMSSAWGVPAAETELYAGISDGEPLGQDRFGLDDNNRVNDSFGLHLLTRSGQWVLWNAVNAPGTQSFAHEPPFY